VAPSQVEVVWQVAHVVGNPADTWLGLLVAWYSALWQLKQSVGTLV
jgi:hypothetical protein